MPHDPRSLLDRYLPYRRFFEVGFWVVNLCLHAVINSVVTILDIERAGLHVAAWQPMVWEWTSALTMLAVVPAVIAFENRFPLYFGTFRKNLPWHVLGSLVFSAAHVAAMVGLRKLAYQTQGSHYDFGDWPREFGYEYLKDWQTYSGILLIAAAYRLLLLRLQGEARLLDPPDDDTVPAEPVERPERFLVRKLGKEFLVAANDIEVLQASGNYVNLRVRGREYPLRTTMAAIEPRLDPARFARVHRSFMVNLDCIAEIEPLDTGDARVVMADGTKVPCSRRYRSTLRR